MSKRYAKDFDPSTLVVERCIYSNAVEELKETQRERDALKAKCAELNEVVEVSKAMGYLTPGVSSGQTHRMLCAKAKDALEKNPATCLADIEVRAVEKAVDNVLRKSWAKTGNRDFHDNNLRSMFDRQLCNYAKSLRQQAGE